MVRSLDLTLHSPEIAVPPSYTPSNPGFRRQSNVRVEKAIS